MKCIGLQVHKSRLCDYVEGSQRAMRSLSIVVLFEYTDKARAAGQSSALGVQLERQAHNHSDAVVATQLRSLLISQRRAPKYHITPGGGERDLVGQRQVQVASRCDCNSAQPYIIQRVFARDALCSRAKIEGCCFLP